MEEYINTWVQGNGAAPTLINYGRLEASSRTIGNTMLPSTTKGTSFGAAAVS